MTKKKILIIDDDSMIRRVLKLELESKGYETVDVTDGEVGLEAIDSEKPDLIIVDIKMPNMDGWTFVKKAKKLGDDKKIPIIVSSSNEETRGLFEAEGIADYLTKPVNPELLHQRIQECLQEN